ncbi:MAG: hypothetical protein QG573_137 [Acidobacteriota bacterium]|nr:hypothetical protein [Acidobacteriota bacterium]
MPAGPDPILLDLFASHTVVDLPAIRTALGGVCSMTAWRRLQRLDYRRSYDHNGRYYVLYDPSRYDADGLYRFNGIHFSLEESLKQTVRRMVHEAQAGATARELTLRLEVRVHNTLADLRRTGEVARETLDGLALHLHPDPARQKAQLAARREQTAAAHAATGVSDAVVIAVLATLVRHPDLSPADVARRLRGHAPPVPPEQVQAVFARFDLAAKKGRSTR